MTLFSGIAGGILRVFRGDNLANALTKFGTERSRTAHTRVNGRRYLSLGELDGLQQMKIPQRICCELPKDASRPTMVSIPDVPEAGAAVQDALDGLAVASKFARAGSRANEYGGAALWMVFDGGGLPHEPLDLSTVKSLRNLVLMDRFELSATFASGDGAESIGYFIDDPGNPDYGKPSAYYYNPAQGGTPRTIHASRLLRFYGDDVPERFSLGWYDGWGAPVMEGIYNTFAQVWGGKEAGAELIQEFGHMIYTLDNLAEIMTGEARDELSEWMALQSEARSTLRATVLGKGQSATRAAMPLTGWSEIFYANLTMLAAEAAMPQTKLYGFAPGGLATDDASALQGWSARCASYQTEQLLPAYNKLLTALYACKQGPTQGRTPAQWTVEIEPYHVPTREQEANVTKTYAEAVKILVDAKAMSPADAADTMRQMPGLTISTQDTASETIGQLPGVMADPTAPDALTPIDIGGGIDGVPDLGSVAAQDTALNGAQISSMLEIIRLVWTNEISYDSGVAAMQRALLVDEPTARELIGERPKGQPVAPEPRTDAESYTPPKGVQDNARRALEVREGKPASQRGMTPVGLARARDLSNGRPVSLDTIEKMASYFARHEVDKQGATWGEQGKGWQAWQGWGGDEGWTWAKSILSRTDALRGDPYTETSPDLPEAVAAMSDAARAEWVRVFNAVLEATDDEQTAYAAAYKAAEKS